MEQVKFAVIKWEEKPICAERTAFPINAAHVEYKIEGLMDGVAQVEYLLYYVNSNVKDAHLATAKTSGFLHFEGTYNGRKGTFTAIEQGYFDKGELNSPGKIVNATGELAELKGSYTYKFTGKESELILDFSL